MLHSHSPVGKSLATNTAESSSSIKQASECLYSCGGQWFIFSSTYTELSYYYSMYYDVYLTYRHGLVSTRKAWNVMSALCKTNCNLLPKHSFSENKARNLLCASSASGFPFQRIEKREMGSWNFPFLLLIFICSANKFQPIGPLVSIHVYYYYTVSQTVCVRVSYSSVYGFRGLVQQEWRSFSFVCVSVPCELF